MIVKTSNDFEPVSISAFDVEGTFSPLSFCSNLLKKNGDDDNNDNGDDKSDGPKVILLRLPSFMSVSDLDGLNINTSSKKLAKFTKETTTKELFTIEREADISSSSSKVRLVLPCIDDQKSDNSDSGTTCKISDRVHGTWVIKMKLENLPRSSSSSSISWEQIINEETEFGKRPQIFQPSVITKNRKYHKNK